MKETEDFFNENYKPLKREMEEVIRSWKDLLCSWIGRINTVKMSTLQKQSTGFPLICDLVYHTQFSGPQLSHL
jgi:hypothetical protein